MAYEVQVYRATVDPVNVARLLEIRPQAIAQAQAACPQLCHLPLYRGPACTAGRSSARTRTAPPRRSRRHPGASPASTSRWTTATLRGCNALQCILSSTSWRGMSPTEAIIAGW